MAKGHGAAKRRRAHPAPALRTKSQLAHKKTRALSATTEDAEPDHPLQEWMIPATDAQGHSAKVFTRCPPKYKHLIAEIVLSKRYPWTTESDLVRVAVHRLLTDIEKDMKQPRVTSDMAQLNALVALASEQLAYAHFKETLDKLQATVEELLKYNALHKARQCVNAVREEIESFEDDYWKKRYEQELVQRFLPLVGKK